MAETLIFGWYHPQVGKTSKNQKQTEHQTNYNEHFCCAVRAHPGGFIFFSSPSLPIRTSPIQDPHLLVNHRPGAMGWSETKEDESKRKRGRMNQEGGTDVRVA